MMKRKVNNVGNIEAGEPKRLRFDIGSVVSVIKNLMSSANAVPFLRKGRFENCEDKMYLEDVLTRVEDGSHQDIDEVFSDIYKVLKTERQGNEIQLEDQEKQVYDDADALIMAGMMMKTAKSLQKEIEDMLKVDEEDKDDTLILDSSPNVLQQLKKQFGSLTDASLHDKAVKMMLTDADGRQKIMKDLSKLAKLYKPIFDMVRADEDSPVYKQLSDYFKRSLKSREEGENCEIENIFKVNNESLSDDYAEASKELEKKLGEKPREELLFHGTSEKAVASIIKDNFNMHEIPNDSGFDGVQRPKRSQYGKGIYFTSSSAKSLLYGNVIIVCKVLLGKCEINSYDKIENQKEIPAEYDSRRLFHKDDKENYICIVKDIDHINPSFVITLKNKQLSAERKKKVFVTSEKRKLSSQLGIFAIVTFRSNK